MTSEHAQLFDAFLNYQQAKGARPRGITGLRIRVRHFLSWLESTGIFVGDVDRRTAKAYLTSLLEYRLEDGSPYKPNTVQAYLRPASVFCQYAVEIGTLTTNPFTGIRGPRTPKIVLQGVLKEPEMDNLLRAFAVWDTAGSNPKAQARRYIAHVVAELQYATGLRIAEVADLRVEDLDLDRRIVTVRMGKRGKSRIAYLSEYAAEILRIFITRMRPLVLNTHHVNRSAYVFGCGHDRLSHTQNTQLAAVAKPLELSIITHGFRHALGYHLLRAGCPLRQIQEIMGHENIKDTEIYTRVDVTSLKAVLDKVHPRGGSA